MSRSAWWVLGDLHCPHVLARAGSGVLRSVHQVSETAENFIVSVYNPLSWPTNPYVRYQLPKSPLILNKMSSVINQSPGSLSPRPLTLFTLFLDL